MVSQGVSRVRVGPAERYRRHYRKSYGSRGSGVSQTKSKGEERGGVGNL